MTAQELCSWTRVTHGARTHWVTIRTPLSWLSCISFDAGYTLQTKCHALIPVLCPACTYMCKPLIVCPVERQHSRKPHPVSFGSWDTITAWLPLFRLDVSSGPSVMVRFGSQVDSTLTLAPLSPGGPCSLAGPGPSSSMATCKSKTMEGK